MTAVSPATSERARKNRAALLHALAVKKHARVAELIGVSEATISRLDVDRIASVLAACGLKIVPEDQYYLEPGELQHLRALLAIELQRQRQTSQFGDL